MINYSVDYWRFLLEALEKKGGKSIPTQGNKETWEPPPAGVVKVNTDASLVNREVRGLGAVIRDHRGGLVASTCTTMKGSWDVVTSEACAVRFGMKIARSLGFDHVIFETDSTQVVHALNCRTYKADYFSTFVKDCDHLANDFSFVKFMVARRSCNQAAHKLAKLAYGIDGTKVWIDGRPCEIMASVGADKACINLH